MKKITMQKIADELNISRTTISLVLKGNAAQYRISQETQDKIKRKIKELNYKPNYFASALNLKKTGVIGVVFPGIHEDFMNKIIKGIEDILYKNGYTIMLCTSNYDIEQEKKNIEQLQYRGVDGLLIIFNTPFFGETYDYSHLKNLIKSPTPVVFIDRYLRSIPCHCVVQDDFFGAYEAVYYLLNNGYNNPCFISLNIDVITIQERLNGYIHALKDFQIEINEGNIIKLNNKDDQSSDLKENLKRLFTANNPPDSIFITTNGLAYKVRYYLKELGVSEDKMPKIVRFGSDVPYFPSGMLTVEQPHIEMGEKAADFLLELIEQKDVNECIYKKVFIKPKFKFENN